LLSELYRSCISPFACQIDSSDHFTYIRPCRGPQIKRPRTRQLLPANNSLSVSRLIGPGISAPIGMLAFGGNWGAGQILHKLGWDWLDQKKPGMAKRIQPHAICLTPTSNNGSKNS